MNAIEVIIFFLGFTIFMSSGVESATFTITNNCPYTIWPGNLTGAGMPQLSSTGFELAPLASQTLEVPTGWSGRFWARTGCLTGLDGKFSCQTADCGSGQVACNGAGAIPPATLAELTLNGAGGLDFYDVSLVDGFNVPVGLTGQGCPGTSCPADVNSACPAELAVKAGPDGRMVACKSACLGLGSPEYCCTGAFGLPETCPPTEYSRIFKQQCPQAYSYAYDDRSSTFTCPTGPNYALTFCP